MSQLRGSGKGLCFPTVRLRTRLQRCCSYAAFVQHGLEEFSAYLFYEVSKKSFLNETRGAKHESTAYKAALAGKP
jgi:hypothetical protein